MVYNILFSGKLYLFFLFLILLRYIIISFDVWLYQSKSPLDLFSIIVLNIVNRFLFPPISLIHIMYIKTNILYLFNYLTTICFN